MRNMSKQDRHGARTTTDIERKYGFSRKFDKAEKGIATAQSGVANAAHSIAVVESALDDRIDYEAQRTDGVIESVNSLSARTTALEKATSAFNSYGLHFIGVGSTITIKVGFRGIAKVYIALGDGAQHCDDVVHFAEGEIVSVTRNSADALTYEFTSYTDMAITCTIGSSVGFALVSLDGAVG